MARCQYCRREVPGLITLCDACFEKGYDRVAHPMPWHQRYQLRLSYGSLGLFVFIFSYIYAQSGIDRDHQPPIMVLVLIAFVFAASLFFAALLTRDPDAPKLTHRILYPFLILFLYFFFRLWTRTTYHPMPHPALIAFAFAVVATLITSIKENRRSSRQ
ncbi:MAG TPA: hypothetical protein VMH04_06790 [Candidatus Solibacter sp.]|nr:hypothetical protein [Candidatus Solibacter sp.]